MLSLSVDDSAEDLDGDGKGGCLLRCDGSGSNVVGGERQDGERS